VAGSRDMLPSPLLVPEGSPIAMLALTPKRSNLRTPGSSHTDKVGQTSNTGVYSDMDAFATSPRIHSERVGQHHISFRESIATMPVRNLSDEMDADEDEPSPAGSPSLTAMKPALDESHLGDEGDEVVINPRSQSIQPVRSSAAGIHTSLSFEPMESLRRPEAMPAASEPLLKPVPSVTAAGRPYSDLATARDELKDEVIVRDMAREGGARMPPHLDSGAQTSATHAAEPQPRLLTTNPSTATAPAPAPPPTAATAPIMGQMGPEEHVGTLRVPSTAMEVGDVPEPTAAVHPPSAAASQSHRPSPAADIHQRQPPTSATATAEEGAGWTVEEAVVHQSVVRRNRAIHRPAVSSPLVRTAAEASQPLPVPQRHAVPTEPAAAVAGKSVDCQRDRGVQRR
jgi:hypothetical protein